MILNFLFKGKAARTVKPGCTEIKNTSWRNYSKNHNFFFLTESADLLSPYWLNPIDSTLQ